MAWRRCLPSCCTSTVNSSSRFYPMIKSCRAICFEVAPNCLKLTEPVSISLAVPGTLAQEEIADNRPDADAEGDGSIRVLMHRVVGGLGALDCPFADAAIDFLAAFQGNGKTLAGFLDFFSGHVGSGRHQGVCIFGECAQVIADCFCLCAHVFWHSVYRYSLEVPFRRW